MSQDEPKPEKKIALRKPPFKERLKSRLQIEFGFFVEFFRKWTFRIVIVALHLAVIFAACYFAVGWSSTSAIYKNADSVPAHMVGLVLGCAKKVDGRLNTYFNR